MDGGEFPGARGTVGGPRAAIPETSELRSSPFYSDFVTRLLLLRFFAPVESFECGDIRIDREILETPLSGLEMNGAVNEDFLATFDAFIAGRSSTYSRSRGAGSTGASRRKPLQALRQVRCHPVRVRHGRVARGEADGRRE
jgi:hypothetical protein